MSVSKILGTYVMTWCKFRPLSRGQILVFSTTNLVEERRRGPIPTGIKKCFMSKETIKMSSSVYGMRGGGGVFCESKSSCCFSSIFFETLQMFCSWSEDVHVVWTLLSKNVWLLFHIFQYIRCNGESTL